MPLVDWSDDYAVGNELIDSQHKKLFDILNRLYDVGLANVDNAIFDVSVDRLYAYAEYHFMSEEKLMEEVGYRGIPRHIQEHKLFYNRVLALKKVSDDDKKERAHEILEFLVNWIVHHIIIEDRKILLQRSDGSV